MGAVGELEAKAKKRRTRRSTWCLLDHRTLNDPHWRLIARISSAPLSLIEAVVVRASAFASGNNPRGSIEGFSIAALAHHWDVDEEVLARVWRTLERDRKSVCDLVPVNGPLTARRAPVPAQRCEDVTARLMGDPSPNRAALAQRSNAALPRNGNRTRKVRVADL
jgi:hypothetical protein